MLFFDSLDGFFFTKIQVPLTLRKCPSDHANGEYYFDIACESFSQKICYLGGQEVESFSIHRLKFAKDSRTDVFSESQWLVEFIICAAKTEEEVICLLNELCKELSLNFIQQSLFCFNYGWSGFSFQPMEVRRRYAGKDRDFGDVAFNSIGGACKMTALNTVKAELFRLPAVRTEYSDLFNTLSEAMLSALRSKDIIARYILLYYLFEVMYGTDEFQSIKSCYKQEVSGSRLRAVALYHYLKEMFHLDAYMSFDKEYTLTPEILERIICARNDLTHRANTTGLSELMYQHLLPILRAAVCATE